MNKKLRILHIIHGFNMGGAETIVKDYARLLDSNKFDLTVLCYAHYNGSPYEKLLKDKNINVIYICDYMPLYSKKGKISKIINHYQRYLLIRKYIHHINPDILHIHLPLGEYIRFANPSPNTIIFYTQHFATSRLLQLKNEVKSIKWMIKKYKFCMIALNDSMKSDLENAFGINDVKVINNGIDISEYKKIFDKRKKRIELGISENKKVLVHIGRFTKIKNQEFIVDVFENIKLKNKDFFLLLVGNGEDKVKIQELLKSKGLCNNSMILSDRTDVPELLRMSDVAIFPSLSEGLGIAAIEMQVAGLPVFASTNVPVETRISNKIEYLDINIGADKWAELIIESLEKENKAIYYNIDNWNIENNVRQLEELYEEYINDDK